MSFAEKMLDMLTSAYNRTDIRRIQAGKMPITNIGRLFYLMGWGFDILRDQTEKVRLWDDIDVAQGIALDRIGANYGVVRGTASDEIYRVMIKVKILSMLAAGNLDTLISAAASLFGVTVNDVKCEEVFPAKVYLYINEDELDEEHKNVASIIADLMKRIKAAGVGIRIFYRVYRTQEANMRMGTAVCVMTTIHVSAESLNRDVRTEANLRYGTGTAVYVRAKCPAEDIERRA